MTNPLERKDRTPGRSDPGPSFSFDVEIDGICRGRFCEARGMQWKSDNLVFQEGGNVNGAVILPGPGKYSPLVLRRGFIPQSAELLDWFGAASRPGREPCSRLTVSIAIHDDSGEPAGRFTLFGAFLSAYTAPSLNSAASGFAVEEIEITYESFEFERGGGGLGALQSGIAAWR